MKISRMEQLNTNTEGIDQRQTRRFLATYVSLSKIFSFFFSSHSSTSLTHSLTSLTHHPQIPATHLFPSFPVSAEATIIALAKQHMLLPAWLPAQVPTPQPIKRRVARLPAWCNTHVSAAQTATAVTIWTATSTAPFARAAPTMLGRQQTAAAFHARPIQSQLEAMLRRTTPSMIAKVSCGVCVLYVLGLFGWCCRSSHGLSDCTCTHMHCLFGLLAFADFFFWRVEFTHRQSLCCESLVFFFFFL